MGATENLLDLLQEEGENLTTKVNQSIEINGSLRFENLIFHYPQRPDINVLKGIDFNVEPNQTLALVGQSGSGKSYCHLARNKPQLSQLDGADGGPQQRGHVVQDQELCAPALQRELL